MLLDISLKYHGADLRFEILIEDSSFGSLAVCELWQAESE